MTETDPFAQPETPTAAPEADPFAQPTPPAPTAEDIEPTMTPDIEDEIEAEAEAPVVPPPDAPDPDVAVTPVTPGPLETAPEDREPEADLPIVDREGDPVEPPAPVAAARAVEDREPAEAPSAPETPVEPAQEPQEAAPQAVAAPEDDEPAGEPSEDDAATSAGPRGGKGPMRLYKLLYQTAPMTWTEYDLATVQIDGVDIRTTGEEEEGEEIEHWIAARNNDHANRVAFAILGRPTQGVRAFPVPRGAWKPKTIKPVPPKPDREILVIS